ncbi:hypothetical protein TVAG_428240 [Trichomonas vaginalis G3]|uniref:Initiator binding domain-containing protein n=1 Tax=Trichomonas vaginalis (strain ATCC PRA-98 / G3) TaxID=412133 RepID=A2G2V1_TRIV3|nr:hypothetical protein TVAGG3_0451880 [Trichomonas vaginalis G3]EAX88515.1 hypothetical protein TVAG_428240 [Trichomonas vaginalis G3]KAI5538211.1 hypothetical protein TVAGG3_0451880 [Trichomonas vaginalis G3]|eukprot:XP_001301445.1 hypothetical protein [Trichomonas vaginalis G3]
MNIFDEIDDIALMKSKVCNDEQIKRIKFTVKIIALLRYTLKHPEHIKTIGIGWFPDGKTIVSNAKILGNFLGLRSNSINTNFRAHNFQIVPVVRSEIITAFGSLPDLANWNKRRQVAFPFSISTTIEDAEKIKPIGLPNSGLLLVPHEPNTKSADNVPAPTPKAPLSFIPQITSAFLATDTDQLLATAKIMRDMKLTEEERHTFLNRTTKDWIAHFGNVTKVNHTELVESFITQECKASDNYCQIFANIDYFFTYRPDNSQMMNDIGFDEYLGFIARYGPHIDVCDNILALTDVNSPNLFINFGSYNTDVRPSFVPWFCPFIDSRTVESCLKSRLNESWVVRQSKNSDSFTLHAKVFLNGCYSITSTHIWYRAVSDTKERLSVMMDDGQKLMRFAQSWDELLYNVMGLKKENIMQLQMNTDRIEGREVGAETIALRTNHDDFNMVMPLSPIALDL